MNRIIIILLVLIKNKNQNPKENDNQIEIAKNKFKNSINILKDYYNETQLFNEIIKEIYINLNFKTSIIKNQNKIFVLKRKINRLILNKYILGKYLNKLELYKKYLNQMKKGLKKYGKKILDNNLRIISNFIIKVQNKVDSNYKSKKIDDIKNLKKKLILKAKTEISNKLKKLKMKTKK